MRLLRPATSLRSMTTAGKGPTYGPDLFEYTSGRFLFNEKLRLRERRVRFCPKELSNAICCALKRDQVDLKSIDKFAEGGFNRIIRATFNDGLEILARLPFNIEAPLRHSVASEAATLTFLRAQGLPVPKVHGYSPLIDNLVKTPYILLEKLEGRPLSDEWFTLPNRTLAKVMKQLVALEKELLSIQLPAHGSLYFSHDLPSGSSGINAGSLPNVDGEIVVGPSAAYAWWYRERALLKIARGPWTDFQSCFEAVAKRELAFCDQYGKPRLDVEPSLRELQNFELQEPENHAKLLNDYLKLAPGLAVDDDHRFTRPTLRHPDLSPGNILVNDEYDIVGLIDWQHTVILPLALCAGIPKHYQNWGDIVSETLQRPETKLPDNFDTLDEDAQNEARELMRKRLVHFYYGAVTLKLSEDHFDALRNENVMLRAKLFDRAAAPWEGNSLDLEHILIEVMRRWPLALDNEESVAQSNVCEAPVQYDDHQIEACLKAVELQEEKEQELEEMREVIGIDSQGWVPTDERLDQARQVRDLIKQKLLEECTAEKERVAIRDHFSFDGHTE